LGEIVKYTIENARKGQIINLPDTLIRMTELKISKPITIKGSPGTIIEITRGSIVIEFDLEQKYKEICVMCECDIIYSDRAN
jgi:hypothetical protein